MRAGARRCVGLLVLMAVVSACSGDGDQAQQSLAEARTGFLGASSVRVTGEVAQDGGRTEIDVVLVGDRGGKGVITVDGTAFRVVRIGEILYFQAPRAFYAAQPSLPTELLVGRWLEGPAARGQFAELAAFTRRERIVDQVLRTEADLEQTRAGDAVALRSATGVLTVTATEPVRPVRAEGEGELRLEFSAYDAPVELVPPSPIVTAAELAAAQAGG